MPMQYLFAPGTAESNKFVLPNAHVRSRELSSMTCGLESFSRMESGMSTRTGKSKDGRQVVTGFNCQTIDTCPTEVSKVPPFYQGIVVSQANLFCLQSVQPPFGQVLPTNLSDALNFGKSRAVANVYEKRQELGGGI
jgi:hypothetical protein